MFIAIHYRFANAVRMSPKLWSAYLNGRAVDAIAADDERGFVDVWQDCIEKNNDMPFMPVEWTMRRVHRLFGDVKLSVLDTQAYAVPVGSKCTRCGCDKRIYACFCLFAK